jgi:pyridoxine/pyridoxamine 5'-phosphate oxidase
MLELDVVTGSFNDGKVTVEKDEFWKSRFFRLHNTAEGNILKMKHCNETKQKPLLIIKQILPNY